jgi:hypothetical protein
MASFPKLVTACWLAVVASSASGMEIRGYSAARHDRFIDFPTDPELNPTAWIQGANYSGVGWSVTNPQRQFALVSPQHFVMATHWGISPGEEIRFRTPSGDLVTMTVDSTSVVMDGLSSTDLTLGRFTEPVPELSGITPFPYLNLPAEIDYRKATLQIFGFTARAARGVMAGFSTQNVSGDTRMHHFYYFTEGDNLHPDDGYFVVGDSGSPSFAMVNGMPALVGTHSAVGMAGTARVNFDTTVRHYITELDSMMSADGYSMVPATTGPVLLTDTAAINPNPLRWMEPGTATFTIENPSPNTATNVVASLTFSVGNAPDSVTAPGWVIDVAGPLRWEMHRATLASETSTTLTAYWSNIPVTTTLVPELEYVCDGDPHRTSIYDLEPAPSYTEWSSALAQPGTNADPDEDSQVNLEEYAFGGDPESGVQEHPNGHFTRLTIHAIGTTATLHFPVRSDAELRGLTYQLQFSNDLESWDEPNPPGLAVSYQDYVPAVPGFKQSVVTFSTSASKKFVRVKVVHDESVPGMTIP